MVNSFVLRQVARLNSDLVDITALYQDWAEPYQLWECKLAILQVHCTAQNCTALVTALQAGHPAVRRSLRLDARQQHLEPDPRAAGQLAVSWAPTKCYPWNCSTQPS
jgi:hypothetical protein